MASKFISFLLKDTLYFKNQEFHFTPGIHLILGKNLNAGGSDNPNAVGKTLFFSMLLEFITEMPLHGGKTDRLREGYRRLIVEKDNKTYTFIKEYKNKKETGSVLVDGEDLGIRGIAEVQKKIREVIRLTDSEISTLMYLDSQVPHPLIRGDSLSRRHFFLEFFRSLEGIGEVRKFIKVEADKLKTSNARLEVLSAEMTRIPLVRKAELIEKQGRVTALGSKVAEVADKLPVIMEAKRLKAELTASREQVSYLKSNPSALDREYFVESRKKLQEIINVLEDSNTYIQKLEEVRAQVKELESNLPENFLNSLDTNVQENLDRVSREVEEIQNDIRASKKAQKDLENSKEDHNNTRSRELSRIKSLKDLIEELKQDADICPTCKQPFDNKHAKSEISSTRKKLEESEQRIKQCEEKLKSIDERIEDLIQNGKGKSKRQNNLELQLEVLNLKLQEQSLESKIGKASNYKKGINYYIGKLKDIQSRLDDIPHLQLVQNMLEEYASIPKNIKLAASSGEDFGNMTRVSEEYAKAVAELERSKEYFESRARLRKEILDIESNSVDGEALEVLIQAFDKKNLELMISRMLGKQLEFQINKYARQVFSEDYKFSIELSNKYEILVSRMHGNRTLVSDVRKLSGAEGKLFPIVLLLSILTFLPAEDRPSILVLDEPTAHMGKTNIVTFMKLLEAMKEIIPCIIVITPLDPTPYEELDPIVSTVVKKGSQAKFFKGYV